MARCRKRRFDSWTDPACRSWRFAMVISHSLLTGHYGTDRPGCIPTFTGDVDHRAFDLVDLLRIDRIDRRTPRDSMARHHGRSALWNCVVRNKSPGRFIM